MLRSPKDGRPIEACVRVGNDFYGSELAKDNAKLRAGISDRARPQGRAAAMPKMTNKSPR
jgi:hypothetical protein